jgi:4-azaleucine resistance transporter AzlC
MPPRTSSRAAFWSGVRAGIPFALASLAFGVSYGVLARSAGLGVLLPIVMSATSWSGTAQFAVASILGSGGGAASALLAAVLLNSRYLGMSMALAPHLSRSRWRGMLQSLAMVDESWALASRPDGGFDRHRLLGAAATLYVGWTGGTAIGVLGGNYIGSPERLGLDAAFPALFLALLSVQLRSRSRWAVAVTAAVVALALVPLTPPGLPILAGSAVALAGLRGR